MTQIRCKAGQAIEILDSQKRRIVIYILKTGGKYTRMGIDAEKDVKIEKKPQYLEEQK